MAMSMPADQLERTAYDLRPFWTADIEAVSSGGSATVSDPNALYTDGSRAMTSNLNMGGNSIINVNLVDGVDVAAFKTAYDNHLLSDSHPMYATDVTLMNAGPGLTGGGSLAADRTFTLGTPSSLGVSTTNNVAGTTHTHALLHSSNPGIQAILLSTDAAGAVTIGGILTMAGGGRLSNGQQLSTNTFASGFLGTGFRIDQGISYTSQTTAEFDNLVVRGLMRVYELVINKIRVSRGSLLVSPGGMKVTTVTFLGGALYQVAGDDDHGFTAGDLLRAQKFTITTGVSGVWQSLCTVTTIIDAKTANITHNSGDAPAVGFEYAVSGHTSNTTRQGLVYLTADDSGAPFMDIVDGLTSHAMWGASSIVRTRVGKLTGITDPFFGTLTGYGIYASRGYFNGVRVNGSIVVGPGVGFSTTAMIYLPFDAPPGAGSANTNGHLGQRAILNSNVEALSAGIFGSAVHVCEATINIFSNPSFESGMTGWTTNNSGGTGTAVHETMRAVHGINSCRAFTGTAGITVYQAITVGASNYAMSAMVHANGQAVTSAMFLFIFDNTLVAPLTITAMGGGWYYCRYVASCASGNRIFGFASFDNLWIDVVQIEQKTYTTPFTPTTRSAAQLSYSSVKNVLPAKGTISAWVYQADTTAVDGYGIVEATYPYFLLFTNASGINFVIGDAGGNQTITQAFSIRAWHHVVATWDIPQGIMKLYVDGVSTASTTPTRYPAIGSTLHVGWLGSLGAYQFNGWIDDLAIIDKAWTADEVTAVYRSQVPLNVTRSNYELVLTDFGAGKVVANAGGIFGTNAGGGHMFSLLTGSAFINTESLGDGDVLIGHNTGSFPNMIYDASAGEFYFRAGIANRVVINTNGMEAGNVGSNRVQLSNLGLTIYSNDTSLDPTSLGAIKFRNLAGTLLGTVVPYVSGGTAVVEIINSGRIRLSGTGASVDAGPNGGDLDLAANSGKAINLNSATNSTSTITTTGSMVAHTNVRIGAAAGAVAAGYANASTGYMVAGNQVVGARMTGWAVPSGTITRSTFNTATVSTAQLAERVFAILYDMGVSGFGHGLIGP